MFFITHIDKFFHNSPGAEMCLGTPPFIEQNLWKKISYRSEQVPLNISKKATDFFSASCASIQSFLLY